MKPDEEAQNLLEELGFTSLPVSPKDICRRLGVHYTEEELNSLDGFLLIYNAGGESVIGVNASIPEPGRKNFTGAHELGHYSLDSLDQQQFHCSRENIESHNPNIPKIEKRANQFAAELLMPRFIYQALVNEREPDWVNIRELADMSDTTLTSTALRFIHLTEDSCCLIVSRDRRIKWFEPSDNFRPYIQYGPLSADTLAFKAFEGKPPPNDFELVKADNWVTGRGVGADSNILEWSLPLNSYGQVLTLLCDEEGLAGWKEEGYEAEDDEIEWEPPTFHKSRRK